MKCCLHKDCWSLWGSLCGCALLRLFLNTGHVQGCCHPWVDTSVVGGAWVTERCSCFCCKVCCLGGNKYLISVTSTHCRLRGRVWHHRHITDMRPGWTVIFEAVILPNVPADDDWLAWVKHYPVVVAAAVSIMTQVYAHLMKEEPEDISDHFGNENDRLVTFSTLLSSLSGGHFTQLHSSNK